MLYFILKEPNNTMMLSYEPSLFSAKESEVSDHCCLTTIYSNNQFAQRQQSVGRIKAFWHESVPGQIIMILKATDFS